MRLNFDLGDREARLGVHATSDTEQDCIAVDLRGGRVQLDRVHKCTAYEGETAAYKVPRHVVSVFGHEGAVEDYGEDEEADKRKETHACLNSRVAPRKLKEERDKVDRYEEDGYRGGHLHEEDDECFVLEELAREDSGFFCSQDAERLLEAEDDEQNAGDDETGDCLAGVPGIDYAAEAYCHYASNTGTDHQKRSEVV